MPIRLAPARAALALTALAALVGCGRDVAVTPPTPDAATAALCTAMTAQLPDSISTGRKWSVDPPSDLVAAWGSPPVVLRCGVPQPTIDDPTAALVAVNDVDWFPESLTDGTRFTTVGRAAAVQVSVPDRYQPSADALVDISAVIAAELPKTQESVSTPPTP